jgi:sulfhydrogenase subunit gamma (sulfur reductase)
MNEAVETNSMKPFLGRLTEISDMAPEIKFFQVEMLDGGRKAFEDYHPGQFAFVSAFGVGEAPFGIANLPSQKSILEFAVQRLGSVTTEMHELGEGDIVGVRGPLGNWFPMETFKDKELIVIGGGIGGAPLRPVIQTILKNRGDYGRLKILWAARNPSLLLFQEEYETWKNAPNTELHLTVDEADQNWNGNVGLITELLEKVSPKPRDAIAITCGPPIMIYYVDKVLTKLGFSPEQSFVTLEARMHCGIGKCGRCNLGEKLVCVDGPVFSMAEIGGMIESFL